MILIGIDTGRNTGIAIWDTALEAFTSIETVKIHQALEIVAHYKAINADFAVRFEDARKRKWIPVGKNIRSELGRAQGAGHVKEHCNIWEDFLKDLHVKFEAVAPKNNATKMLADTFKSYTGWKERTNEHERDAAMLVFGLKNLLNNELLRESAVDVHCKKASRKNDKGLSSESG